MWVIAVDAAVVVVGLGLLAMLAWRVVIRPAFALSRSVAATVAAAGDALAAVSAVYAPDSGGTSGRRVSNEGIDVP